MELNFIRSVNVMAKDSSQELIIKLNTNKHPSHRSGFGMCNHDGFVYIFGGFSCHCGYFDDFWYINVNNYDKHVLMLIIAGYIKYTKQIPTVIHRIIYNFHGNSDWIEMDNTQEWPSKRSDCTMEYYNGKIYLIGGYRSTGGTSLTNICSDNIWEYNINKNIWKEMNVINGKGMRISNHASVIYRDYVIIYGGISSNDEISDELWILNLNTLKCDRIETLNKPEKRYNHSMTIVNNKIFMCGGGNYVNAYCEHYIWCINASDLVNNKIDNNGWIKMNINETDLYCNSIFSYNNNKLISLSGKDTIFRDIITTYNDINEFNHNYIKTQYVNPFYRTDIDQPCLIMINKKSYIFIIGYTSSLISLDYHDR